MSGFFVACSRGLEELLAGELQRLGCPRATPALSGVNAEGDLALAQRALLHSRLASRVLWPLAEFAASDADQLYAGMQSLDWSRHMLAQARIAIEAHGSAEGLTHTRFVAQRAKDAIVDQFRADGGERPSVDLDAPELRLAILLVRGRARLSVDLGGAMHRRGWRMEQGEAPLRETLAAAVLLRGRWPERVAEGGSLLDPMCGSGTLPIEGVLMAAGVAPGLQRHGDALPTQWRGFDATHWHDAVASARAQASAGLAALAARAPMAWGRDLDPRAIAMARANAERAGVTALLRFDAGDVSALPDDLPAHGLVVCNPPYDQRLGADAGLYRALGDALKRAVPGWSASLLCGDEALARATGLRARKLYRVHNGALECPLLVCDRVQAEARPERAAVALTAGAQMVANRLRKNLKRLKPWLARDQVSCFRAYDADLPEYAAAVDVYEAADQPGERWLHVQEYAAPAEIPEADARRRRHELLAAVREVFALPAERIALKTRQIGKGGSKYGRMDARDQVLWVREGAVRLKVNLFDQLDSGLFLDHRPLRMRLAGEARGKRFLNLFAYTGSASVHAAVAGASATTSVDLAANYLAWCAENLAANGMQGARHALVQADAMQWLAHDGGVYDLIFCDPPTFSNSARAGDFDVQKHHVELLSRAVARLSSTGVLYFSNNYRRFKLDADAIAAFAEVEDISAASIPADFARNPRIHRSWRIVRR